MKIKRFKGDWLLYLIVGSILALFAIITIISGIVLGVDDGLFGNVAAGVSLVLGIILITYTFLTSWPKIMIQKESFELTVLKVLETIILVVISILALVYYEETSGFPRGVCIFAPLFTYTFIAIIRGYTNNDSVKSVKENVWKYLYVLIMVISIILLTVTLYPGNTLNDNIVYFFIAVVLITGLSLVGLGLIFMPKKNKNIEKKPTQDAKPN